MLVQTEEPGEYNVPLTKDQLRKLIFSQLGSVEKMCLKIIQLSTQVDAADICGSHNQQLFIHINHELANLPDSLTVYCDNIKENH